MKVALLQLDVAWEDKSANMRSAEALVKEAASTGCDIAVLPETFSTGFSMNVEGIAEAENGPTAQFLGSIAKKYSINVIGGFSAEGHIGFGRNVAHAYGRDGLLKASYAKMQPFCYAGENTHYEAGDRPVVFDLDGAPASVFICYDLRFPELMRKVARDVRVIFVIANWPGERISQWSALLRARAIENQCFVAGVNRTGSDPNVSDYPGASSVMGPGGEELCTGSASDRIVVCEFDIAMADRVRAEYPFLDDMRT